ncbi:MAG: GEVED domain-containing protein [Planctomycetota bacterium]|jgi:T5SS/PEP-CTERM-associated repeat protein
MTGHPHRHLDRSRVLHAIAAAALGAAATGPAPAADIDWTGAGDAYDGVAGPGGWFNFTQNWSPADLPNFDDRAVFNIPGTYTVTFAYDPTTQYLRVEQGNVTFRNASGNRVYSVSSPSYAVNVSGGVLVLDGPDLSVAGRLAVYGPAGGTSSLHVWPGSVLTALDLVLGNVDGDGGLVVDGVGASLVVTGVADLGSAGETGTLTVANGATADLGRVDVGFDGADRSKGYLNVTSDADVTTGDIWLLIGGVDQHGEVLVTDAGSTLTMQGASGMSIRDGLVRVENGGVFTTGTGSVDVGTGDSLLIHGGTFHANGTLWISGTLDCDATGVLDIAPGLEMNVEDGGLASFGGPLIVDRTMTVSDAGSSLDVTGALTIGDVGTGDLTVDTDATATSGNLYVGHGGTGALTIGAWSGLTSEIGRVGFGATSTGTATITGTWTNNQFMVVGDHGSGTMTVEPFGTVSGTFGYLGYNGTADGTATVRGTWTLANALNVGLWGTGDLTVEDGTVSSSPANIGFYGPAIGTVTVTGTDAEWTNAGDLRVGRSGDGTLDVLGGGLVSSGHVYVGDEAVGTGTVTVSGWQGDDSRLASAGNLYVGWRGDGALTVTDFGDASGATLVVGEVAGSTGTVTVDDYGRITLANYLRVGVHGQGDVTLTAGGDIVMDGWSVFVGQETGSHGTISGNGELYGVNNLYVGRFGVGVLDVWPYGEIESQNTYIGRYAGGDGTVTIDGATWDNTGSVWVGGGPTGAGGPGSLLVTRYNADVAVGGTVRIWAPGAVQLEGGTVAATTVDHTAGGMFTFTGGELHVATFLGDLVQDGGTLDPTLTDGVIGATTVSGDWVQNGGALRLDLASDLLQWETLTVQGTATLDGWLDVEFLPPGATPQYDDTFTILTAGHVEGRFVNAGSYVDVYNGRFEVVYDDTSVSLTHYVPMPVYCWAWGNCDPHPHVARVEMGAIDNTSGCRTYSDFSTMGTEVVPGGGALLRVTPSEASYGNRCGVWIDWNQDRDFDDPGETITVPGSPGPGPYDVPVSPPPGTPTGVARMRIHCTAFAIPQSCGQGLVGEVEDYSLLVVASASCPADVSGDGLVNVTDLLQVLAMWGGPGADATADGDTDVADLLLVLADWGLCP